MVKLSHYSPLIMSLAGAVGDLWDEQIDVCPQLELDEHQISIWDHEPQISIWDHEPKSLTPQNIDRQPTSLDDLFEDEEESDVPEEISIDQPAKEYIAVGIDIGAQNMGVSVIKGVNPGKKLPVRDVKFEIIRFIHYRPRIDKKMRLGQRVRVLIDFYDEVLKDISPDIIGIETQFANRKDMRAVNFIAKDLASMSFGILQERYKNTDVISLRPTLNKASDKTQYKTEEGGMYKSKEQRKHAQWRGVMEMLMTKHKATYAEAITMMDSSHPCDALLLAITALRRADSRNLQRKHA